ncbi:hypothetical protein C453_13821 [Haloferax elongans ATCC BAA-1513]|uniref:Uncharacterized protein n=1 Tax=Haloferax elongans ATCC BAA-1513 TaxID=1230453 RepID=M0HH27_HALEO|nr:hypothetical protein [Haloferax elongans]ELZ83088.1 hypothetical protein C453_13821 [Haloferax elongans ATCC BAA-1513]
MADFTLFEVHLHDGFEFSPTNRAPLMGAQDESDDEYDVEFEDDYEAEYESESEGGSKMGLLFGLVLLIGIAAGVRYLRGGGEDLDELADLDDREEVELGA